MERNFSFLFDEEEDKPVKTTKTENRESSSSQQFPLIREYSFVKPKRIKYILSIESKMHFGGMRSENTVEIRYILTLKEITKDIYNFELLTLDNTIVNTNNDGFTDIHKIVTQAQKALNEVEFLTDRKGNIRKILNLKNIQEKWNVVKRESMEYSKIMTSLTELLSINDNNFEQMGGVAQMVMDIEFYDLFIKNIYGRKYPFTIEKTKSNFFRNIDIPYYLDYSNGKKEASSNIILFNGDLKAIPSKKIKEAYKDFASFLKIDDVKPKYIFNGSYEINLNNGFLNNGEVLFSENIHPQLNATIFYKLKRYE